MHNVNTDSMTWWEQLEHQRELNLVKYGRTLMCTDNWIKELHDENVIIDPDGWDRSSPENFTRSWNEAITIREYYRRMDESTTAMKRP